MSKQLRRRAALMAVGFAMSGCAVGPRYKAPEPAPVTYHSADPRSMTDAPFDPRWWTQFDDPVLNSLVGKSITANTTIRMAQARLAESRAVFDERKLDRYPTVPAGASYNYAKQQIPGFFDKPATINTFRSGFDASWEIDLFGRVRHGIAAARSDNQALEADLRDAEVSVVAELARNYFELRGAQWRLAVAEQSLKNQQDTLRLTQLRRDAGVGEEQDVASAAARVAATDATIPLLDFEQKRAAYRIAVLTGTRPGELSSDLSPRNYTPIDKALPIGNASDLLRRRPDVRAAERRLSAATERQGIAVAQLFPQVSVSAFVGFLAGRGSLFFTTQSFATTASPSVTWSAFDLGRARARVRASDAATEEALASYDETVLRALEEAENSFSNYNAQQQRLMKLNAQARESKRAADIARLRYREGVIDFLSLLDAERTQLQAEDGVAESERDVYTAVIAIYKALGGIAV
jgi:multidrug efflux system outer membrane protein